MNVWQSNLELFLLMQECMTDYELAKSLSFVMLMICLQICFRLHTVELMLERVPQAAYKQLNHDSK